MGCLEDIEMAEKEQGEPFRLTREMDADSDTVTLSDEDGRDEGLPRVGQEGVQNFDRHDWPVERPRKGGTGGA